MQSWTLLQLEENQDVIVHKTRIYSTDFYTAITIKHNISKKIWTIRYFSVDPLWHLVVGTFQTVINSVDYVNYSVEETVFELRKKKAR